eukprot:COSAG06_NODE_858_length_11909_cov_6.018036_14_plen_125_part_00
MAPKVVLFAGDGDISTLEMEEFLLNHPQLMRAMCTSALVEETAFETRLGLSYLPSEMLRHRHCQGFPRSRVELALAPVSVVVDMRDMATINTLTVSATKGKRTVLFVRFYINMHHFAKTGSGLT